MYVYTIFSFCLVQGAMMGVEWGGFSASYSGSDMFFARIRGVEDEWNSYIACGICSAASRFKEGNMAMAQGFATGFAFVYVLEQVSRYSVMRHLFINILYF
jgi:hypothetical protein